MGRASESWMFRHISVFLGFPKIKRVHFLGANVSDEERRIVRSQTHPQTMTCPNAIGAPGG